MTRISPHITATVYGRRRASRTIHMVLRRGRKFSRPGPRVKLKVAGISWPRLPPDKRRDDDTRSPG